MILGTRLPEWVVDGAKLLAIAAVMIVVVLAIALYVDSITRTGVTKKTIGVVIVIAGVFVAASFALLYTYVGALVNPRASTGLLFVLALLLWVNVVVRSFLVGLSWIGSFQTPRDLEW
jgi:hypothetical protein